MCEIKPRGAHPGFTSLSFSSGDSGVEASCERVIAWKVIKKALNCVTYLSSRAIHHDQLSSASEVAAVIFFLIPTLIRYGWKETRSRIFRSKRPKFDKDSEFMGERCAIQVFENWHWVHHLIGNKSAHLCAKFHQNQLGCWWYSVFSCWTKSFAVAREGWSQNATDTSLAYDPWFPLGEGGGVMFS